MFRKLFTGFLFASVASTSYAQIFDIEIRNYGGLDAPIYAPVRALVDQEIQNAEDKINKEFPSGAPDRMMKGMANSSAMAGKGIGTDYASNMSVFLIGANVGVAADLEKPKDTDSELSGLGIAPGVVVGLNLGFMDTKRILGMDTNRLNLYFNFMKYDFKQKMEDKDGNESVIGLDSLAFGTHMRYDWIKPSGTKLLGWGGVKFTFGFEYNKTDYNFQTNISEAINETSSTGEVISGTVTGAPEASINASTMSIPLAISTDVQILYFLSLYTGLGVDYNMGEAKGSGNLNGQDSVLNCSGGTSGACTTGPGAGGSRTITVRPKANLDTTAKVDPFTARAFAGAQVNLPWTRIFVQVDKSLSNEVVAATTGLRFAF